MTYYEQNKERIKAYNRERYRKNKERCMAKAMEWQRNHPFEMSEIHRRYYLKHGEERRAYGREYYRKKAGA